MSIVRRHPFVLRANPVKGCRILSRERLSATLGGSLRIMYCKIN